MQRLAISQTRLTRQLHDLGVSSAGVLLLHCAFSQVRPVEGGPIGLIEALLTVLGPHGTLVMPSMTDDDEQPFDPHSTPCRGLGVVADSFWRLPAVLRSDNPHAFAATGPLAQQITAPHPLDLPHGLDSPVGRVYAYGGQVLLLGVGHDADTTIHLAEWLAGVRYRRPKHVSIRAAADGKQSGEQILRYDYLEIDHCCQRFALVDQWLDAAQLQRHGQVGYASARLANAGDIVRVVTEQLQRNETIFLHPVGVDAECDEARASIVIR